MKLNTHYHLKGRALKTALAVFLAELFAVILGRSSSFYSSIAAVICMMKNHEMTQQKGIERLIGTVVGGLLGWAFLELFIRLPYYKELFYPFMAPFGVLLVIYLLNVMNRKTSCMIGCVVFLSIAVNFNRTLDQIPVYVFDRILDTALGIAMASFVTALPLWNPKPEKKEESL